MPPKDRPKEVNPNPERSNPRHPSLVAGRNLTGSVSPEASGHSPALQAADRAAAKTITSNIHEGTRQPPTQSPSHSDSNESLSDFAERLEASIRVSEIAPTHQPKQSIGQGAPMERVSSEGSLSEMGT